MDIKTIEKNTIFLFTRGSQAYGTNNAESDEDIGGVCMPTKEVVYGLKKFEQKDNWVDENGEKQDKVIYNFNKAIDLMINNNPNMLDFIYAPERVVKYLNPAWSRVIDLREDFLCSKAKWTFQGYAVSQLNRIKTHRAYLLNPPKAKPNRADYDLPEKSIFPVTQCEVIAKISSKYVKASERDAFFTEMVNLFDKEGALIFKKYIPEIYYPFAIADFKKGQKEFLQMISSVSGNFLKDEFTHAAENELRYLSSHYNWQRFTKWEKGRNAKRAIMEKKCGYDTKHAMHLVRLLKMAVEIMSGKGVLVDRTNIDRDLLMEIRDGNWNFDQIIELSEKLNKEADELYKVSKLPRKANVDKINELRVELLDAWIN